MAKPNYKFQKRQKELEKKKKKEEKRKRKLARRDDFPEEGEGADEQEEDAGTE